jgi:hypothetical protein
VATPLPPEQQKECEFLDKLVGKQTTKRISANQLDQIFFFIQHPKIKSFFCFPLQKHLKFQIFVGVGFVIMMSFLIQMFLKLGSSKR